MGDKAPHYYGGQAVVEGVMMRGRHTWAVAVRRPTNEIYVECQPVRGLAGRYALFRKPVFRGVAALGEALTIGIRALTISANQSAEEDEKLTPKQTAMSLVFALVFFIAFFIVLPTVLSGILQRNQDSSILRNLVEGLVRIGIFVGYLLAISFMKEIRRVFMYHGAEHKTIAAYEAGEPRLEPDAVDKYSTLHVRCGTNFLIIVMILTVFVYSFFPWRAVLPRVGSRIIAIPLLAGLSYEMLRLGAAHLHNPLMRLLMKPGLWLQMITTKPPTSDQIEVAIRAFEAVLPLEERTRVASLPSPVVAGDPGESAGEPGASPPGDAGPPPVR